MRRSRIRRWEEVISSIMLSNFKLTDIDFLQVALDVSYDGAIGLPPYPKDAAAKIYNITIFLFSYDTGKNFTISNGTATAGNASLGNIMLQEPGSTVKHVNWNWPDCLVGNGAPQKGNSSNARGTYNVGKFFPPANSPPLSFTDLHASKFPSQWIRLQHHLQPTHPSNKLDPRF